jgi:hypothetical protein
MYKYIAVDVQTQGFGTSGRVRLASRPSHFTPGEKSPVPIGGWVGRTVGLGDMEK